MAMESLSLSNKETCSDGALSVPDTGFGKQHLLMGISMDFNIA